MKKLGSLILAICLALGFSTIGTYAEDKIAGSASIGVFNRYIFRGYEIGSHSAVIQPALSNSYKGFSLALWSNIDSNERATQSFAPDNEGNKSLNETDLTLGYTYAIDKISLTGGYIYYGTKYTAETEELFLSATYDMLLKPTIAIYRDINEYGGTYFNLSVAHSIPLHKDITLDLGASAGYFVGSDDYWRTYESSTEDYTGEKYSALHDGMIRAGFTIPITKSLSLQPVAQYWLPLSSKARRTVNGNSYNHNGKLDETFVAGINLTSNF